MKWHEAGDWRYTFDGDQTEVVDRHGETIGTFPREMTSIDVWAVRRGYAVGMRHGLRWSKELFAVIQPTRKENQNGQSRN